MVFNAVYFDGNNVTEQAGEYFQYGTLATILSAIKDHGLSQGTGLVIDQANAKQFLQTLNSQIPFVVIQICKAVGQHVLPIRANGGGIEDTSQAPGTIMFRFG